MLTYRILADLVVVFHAIYVGVVVFGLLAIWIGLATRRRWARNFWLRTIHLAMIGVVAVEAIVGLVCPLTELENRLRMLGGQQTYAGSFIGEIAHDLLFYDAPQWVFSLLHCLFGLVVLITYLAAPPRRPSRMSSRSSSAAPSPPESP